jgi:phosphatidate cytidylyltransferase
LKEFIRRTLSGALFVMVMLAAIWFSKFTLLALLLVIAGMALSELINLTDPSSNASRKLILIIGAALILVLNFLAAAKFAAVKIMLLDIAILMIIQSLPLLGNLESFTSRFINQAAAFLYVLLPLSLVAFICFFDGSYDYRLMFGFFILLWTYDSFAYISGVMLGKHRILPSVSPKKSWEGLAGGLIFSAGMAWILSLIYTFLSFGEWAGLAFVIVITGTAGDFIESAIKRNAGVKDSGKFLPGHGGVLDRFDSVLFSIPFVYLYLVFIIW